MRRVHLIILLCLFCLPLLATERERLNFNADWRMAIGDFAGAEAESYSDGHWERIALPRAFNGEEAFAVDVAELTDTIVWYRKHFRLDLPPATKVFIEFEGVHQSAEIWVNGRQVGTSTNGDLPFGFDLSSYIRQGENVIAVRVDNNRNYRDSVPATPHPWNDRTNSTLYGGISKNVYLHLSGLLYQTLPLYGSLGTTGPYIYATDYDIHGRSATIHVESEVRNEDSRPRSFSLVARVLDAEGHEVCRLVSEHLTMRAGEQRTIHVNGRVEGLHFWSWGYGYLYTVQTLLEAADGSCIDDVFTRTGFRKTEFREGKFWLNDRCMMIHGYAQSSSNEWPGVGSSVPPWLSDYSNDLMVKSGGNLVRWMRVTPWKQDIESCDRVGLPQAMPLGDAGQDLEGAQWQPCKEVMRDVIIYNRNNPSIIFYECGNKNLCHEHLEQIKALRDEFDPYGGRVVGSRAMLDSDEMEYSEENLYVSKSSGKPVWTMEYGGDEGLRKYWDDYSYPYHREGDGPLFRGKPANDYNHNMDAFAVEMVRRWHDFWLERPGTATRVCSGAAKHIFSDSNTDHRGESNFRASGVTDAMRTPKDAFFAHQVMWTGWVDDEEPRTRIIGHWNYTLGTVKPVYVVSNADEVELFLNGKSLGFGDYAYNYLFTFDSVRYEPGELEAVGYFIQSNRYSLANTPNLYRVSSHKVQTSGEPHHLRLTTIENPERMKADGADMALVQVEVVDMQDRRCPLDDRFIHFSLEGEGEWIGGIGTRNNRSYQLSEVSSDSTLLEAATFHNNSDNYVGATSLPTECGVCRVLVRSTTTPGTIHVAAAADRMGGAEHISIRTQAVDTRHYLPSMTLKGRLDRGPTPDRPSFEEQAAAIRIAHAQAGSNGEQAARSFDDNERTEWRSNGELDKGWITYRLARRATVSGICMKVGGWHSSSYPLEIYATNLDNPSTEVLLWSGQTESSHGYIHLKPQKYLAADEITLRLKGAGKSTDFLGSIAGLTAPNKKKERSTQDESSINELRIIEIEFLEERSAENTWRR
ncbi:MAG: DUF4982 domain-containing protein [Bacteroidaceae bacterium]|nr:DUF4982 domain-containing protein [Bacteroidaceae bacterium]